MYKQLYWTQHAKSKMRQYRLSKSRILRVLYRPSRTEKGIAPETIAVMQPASNPITHTNMRYGAKRKKVGEIWLMYQDTQKMRKIITAWRYPGKSPIGEKIPIPEDIRLELTKNYKL